MKDRHYCYSRRSDNMSPSLCGFRPTTGIRYNIAYKTSDRNPNTNTTITLSGVWGNGPIVHIVCVRVSVTCLISNVVTNPCSRPKPTRTGGHVIWTSGIAAMPILHSPDCPTALGKFQFPEPESDSNSRPMDRVALGCHKGS